MVELLLQQGADLNVAQNNGNTALHLAAGHGNTEMMEVLVEYGAEVDARNNKGHTPLHRAVASCKFDAVQFLVLEGGADVTTVTKDGMTTMALVRNVGMALVVCFALNVSRSNRTRAIPYPLTASCLLKFSYNIRSYSYLGNPFPMIDGGMGGLNLLQAKQTTYNMVGEMFRNHVDYKRARGSIYIFCGTLAATPPLWSVCFIVFTEHAYYRWSLDTRRAQIKALPVPPRLPPLPP